MGTYMLIVVALLVLLMKILNKRKQDREFREEVEKIRKELEALGFKPNRYGYYEIFWG